MTVKDKKNLEVYIERILKNEISVYCPHLARDNISKEVKNLINCVDTREKGVINDS